MNYKIFALLAVAALFSVAVASQEDNISGQDVNSSSLAVQYRGRLSVRDALAASERLRALNESSNTTVSTVSTSSTTGTTLCGRTSRYCGVDFDSNGDGTYDCCTNQSNPMCAECLGYCKSYCGEQGYGLISCFNESGVVSCECSSRPPSCYPYTTSTVASAGVLSGQSKTGLVFFMTFVVLFLGSIGAWYFVNSVK